MRKVIRGLFWMSPLILSGCGGIPIFLEKPLRGPAEWLEAHPHFEWGGLILSQPSSSVLVFMAAFFALWIGRLLFRDRGEHLSRFYWACSWIFGGLGAVFAGISYQLFAYEIKCRGYEFCLWTSVWELAYLVLTVVAGACSVVAVSHSFLGPRGQSWARIYGLLSSLIYCVTLGIGLGFEQRFLCSFEFLVLYTGPGGLGMAFILLRWGRPILDARGLRVYSWTAILLLGAVLGYGFYGALGIEDGLWERGIWFTANDAFHGLMMVWLLFVWRFFLGEIRDREIDEKN